MTPVRAPAIVRGDVPGLLRRGMPVTFIGEGLDGEPVECVGVVLDDAEPNTTWRVANLTDGVPADLYGDETRAMQPLWTNPAALYLSLHWLAEKGHPACLWMLPATHGGRVTEWDGLTAWEVSAILVSVSVGRVARGVGPIRRIYVPSVPESQADGTVLVNGYRFFDMFAALGEIDKNKANALTDGCCLQVPGGILTPSAAPEMSSAP